MVDKSEIVSTETICALVFWWSMIFSGKPDTTFLIMLDEEEAPR
jgi:hypothetical protein